MGENARNGRRISSLRAAIGLTAIAVAGLAGCGGSGSSGAGGASGSRGTGGAAERGFSVRADTTVTTAAASLTKARFLARMNRTCRRTWPTILHNFVVYGRRPGPELGGRRRYAKAVRLTFTAGLDFYVFDAIYNLGAPPGDEERVEEMIGTMQESVERTQRGLRPIPSPRRLQAHFAAYNRLARAYGLDDCLVAGAHLPPAL
jgi:hypothetical protein